MACTLTNDELTQTYDNRCKQIRPKRTRFFPSAHPVKLTGILSTALTQLQVASIQHCAVRGLCWVSSDARRNQQTCMLPSICGLVVWGQLFQLAEGSVQSKPEASPRQTFAFEGYFFLVCHINWHRYRFGNRLASEFGVRFSVPVLTRAIIESCVQLATLFTDFPSTFRMFYAETLAAVSTTATDSQLKLRP